MHPDTYREVLRRLDRMPDATTHDVVATAIYVDPDVEDYLVDGGWAFEDFCAAHTPAEALSYIRGLWCEGQTHP